MPDGRQLVASRKVAGVSELWLVDAQSPEQEPVRIWRGDSDTVLGAFDISPTGTELVAAMKRPRQGWNLEKLNMDSKTWLPLTDTKAAESSPSYLPDGRIMFSADYDGVFDIYVLDESCGQLDQWTRELGGALRPVWQPGAGLVYQAYDTNGYQLRYLAQPQALSTQNIQHLLGRYDYPPVIEQTVEKKANLSRTAHGRLLGRIIGCLLFILMMPEHRLAH